MKVLSGKMRLYEKEKVKFLKNVVLANVALKMAKLSANSICLGPFYEHEKPEKLKALVNGHSIK